MLVLFLFFFVPEIDLRANRFTRSIYFVLTLVFAGNPSAFARYLHLMYKNKKNERGERIVICSVGNEKLRSRDSYFL